jgi:hypothetical protein
MRGSIESRGADVLGAAVSKSQKSLIPRTYGVKKAKTSKKSVKTATKSPTPPKAAPVKAAPRPKKPPHPAKKQAETKPTAKSKQFSNAMGSDTSGMAPVDLTNI